MERENDMAKAKSASGGTVATQVCKAIRVCSAVTKFDLVGEAKVNGKDIEPLNNAVYISNAVLERLGSPKTVILTIAPA